MGTGAVGAALTRREDARFLAGRGEYVGDIAVPGLLEAAFLRSPHAHARIRSVDRAGTPADRAFVVADLAGVPPLRAEINLRGYRPTEQPILADGKVLFAGQSVALCLGDSRSEAEDLAERIEVDYDPLPCALTAADAMAEGAPRLHEDRPDNLLCRLDREADLDAAIAGAAVHIRRRLSNSRQAMVPLEGRAILAQWHDRDNQLLVHCGHQHPHLLRSALSHHLGLPELQIRVVAPDIGGGFGYKSPGYPEEIAVCWAALRTGRPVRWLEDRYEHLTAGASAREHDYVVDAWADAQGRLLALDVQLDVSIGAYSFWPHSGAFEAIQAIGIVPGPYALRDYRIRTRTVLTNKPPQTPYRAVARPSACFLIELTMDAIARELGQEPAAVRAANLIRPEAMPYTSVTGKIYDSGDYPESLALALAQVDMAALRDEQAARSSDLRLGVGLAMYVEHTGISTSTFGDLGIALMPGDEQATVRMTPDGGVEIAMGVQNHGQGMETTIAQVAAEVMGIAPDRVRLIHGDTGLTPWSTGTYASRAMIMNGGAAALGCERLLDRLRVLAGHLLQCDAAEIGFADGAAQAPSGASASFADLARLWYRRPNELPAGLGLGGLEVSVGYRPQDDRGAFSYSTHLAVVEVDTGLGTVALRDYVVVHDCGTRVNPLIVDGQVIGGVVQGIGTALFEECSYDAEGQPLAVTLGDYLLPGAAEMPRIRLVHTDTPSPRTPFGIKGVGEGGAIAPPAAIANAVNDALRPWRAEVTTVPVTPERVLEALERAAAERGSAAGGAA